ncbi:MAG TPA: YHS domain-containing protein [Blastocatellia bacterium]|nr:YHS domain-containing protein [Blastocatellia bacterium]
MNKPSTVTDIVCGTEVDTQVSTETSEYNGTTYYFCSAGCKQKFDHAPQLYAGGPTINPIAAP